MNLETLPGKCTSMSVAVPPASLYKYHMYRPIAHFRCTGGSSILARVDVQSNGGRRYEMETWLVVGKRMNGASWYEPNHNSIAITGTTDRCVISGMRKCRSEPPRIQESIRAAADFPPDLAQAHISIKETFALHEVLRLLVDDQPEYLRGSIATIDVDNTTMFYSVRKGRAKDAYMHQIVCQLFWLHVEADCTLKLRWAPLKDNAGPETSQHFRLGGRGYGSYGHDCVLTAAPYFRGGGRGEPLPFYSRHHTDGSSGIDVLAQDAGRMPSSTDPCFGYCPPPTDGWGRHRTFTRVPCASHRRNPSSLSLLVSIGNFARPKETNVFF